MKTTLSANRMLKVGAVRGQGQGSRRGRLTLVRACSKRTERCEKGKDVEMSTLSKVQGSVCSLALAASVLAGAGGVDVIAPQKAHAELRQSEYDRGGEFNRGSAKQFGGIDMMKQDIVKDFGKDLRLSNFVQANIRYSKLRGANLRGAYMMKLVAPDVDFTGADMSDALMDRSVFVDADFTDAILERVVLTSSDLNGAKIEGADFTDALLDKTTQQKLCQVAAGTNSVTGVSTRASLKCGGSRFSARNSSPSRYMTDESASKPKQEFDADRFSMYTTKPDE